MTLQSERHKATFPLEGMAHVLFGDPETYERFLQMQRIFDAEPGLRYDINYHNKSRQEQV